MANPQEKGALKLRLMLGRRVAIGPGKADLLEGIRDTGSISAAGRRMRMSYKRAWQLVEEMNECFRTPLVQSNKGGSGGGGAQLTAAGIDVLGRFRRIEADCEAGTRTDLAALRRRMRGVAED